MIALSIVHPLSGVVEDSFGVSIKERNRALRNKLGDLTVLTLLHDPPDVGRVQCIEIDVSLYSTVDKLRLCLDTNFGRKGSNASELLL